jgi:hypothetical protein
MPKASSGSDRTPAYGTEQQVAKYLGVARITAQMRRLRRREWPPAYRFGKKIYYRWDEVDAWAAARRIGGPK